MKIFKKSFTILILSIISAFAFSGCNTTKYECDGSIKDFSVDGEYIHVTFNETHDKNYYFYPIMYVYKTDFKKYNCKNLEALLSNEDFVNDHMHYSSVWAAERENGPDYKRHHSTDEIATFSYWLFYDYFAVNSTAEFNTLPEDFNDVKDIANYTGYIKF